MLQEVLDNCKQQLKDKDCLIFLKTFFQQLPFWGLAYWQWVSKKIPITFWETKCELVCEIKLEMQSEYLFESKCWQKIPSTTNRKKLTCNYQILSNHVLNVCNEKEQVTFLQYSIKYRILSSMLSWHINTS